MGLLRRTPTSAGVRFAQVTVGFSLFEPKARRRVSETVVARRRIHRTGRAGRAHAHPHTGRGVLVAEVHRRLRSGPGLSVKRSADEPPPPPMPAWMTWSSGLDAPARAAVGLYWNLTLDFAGTALFISLFFLKFARDVELTPNASQEDLDKVEQGRPALKLFRDALSDLATFEPKVVVDQGAVDRQFAGAIEALTHRVDSWVTSLATTRLRALRESQQTGIRLGAYGWLVDVEPTAPGARKADAGWVLTPSLTHAATAAVLHSGWAAHSHPDAFAVDLTSDRVRRAQAVLTALRDGRALEELLGYQLERALHDGLADDLIAPLREAFPLPPVDPALGDGSEARAEHGRRIVVDGDAAQARWCGLHRGGPTAARRGRQDRVRPADQGAAGASGCVGAVVHCARRHRRRGRRSATGRGGAPARRRFAAAGRAHRRHGGSRQSGAGSPGRHRHAAQPRDRHPRRRLRGRAVGGSVAVLGTRRTGPRRRDGRRLGAG